MTNWDAHQHVLLIRTPTSTGNPSGHHPVDSYSAPLTTLWARPPIHLPLLTTAYPATAHLAALLAAAPPHRGVIITSARSIHALHAALAYLADEGRAPSADWGAVDWFVVGRPTREAVLGLRFGGGKEEEQDEGWKIDGGKVLGEETGCADMLGPFIVRHLARSANPPQDPSATCPIPGPSSPPASPPPPSTPTARLLYLTGDKNRDTLDAHLAAGSGAAGGPVLQVDRLCAYSTAVAADFPARFEAALSPLLGLAESEITSSPAYPPPRAWIVLFSPSGAGAVLPELRRLGLLPPPPPPPPPSVPGVAETGPVAAGAVEVRLVAIGPTTRTFVEREGGVECAAMAATPDPEGVREAIRAAAEALGSSR